MARWLTLVALVGAAACAHLPPCPGEGGPRWTEWSSPHFRVLTDVEDEREAEGLATQLEFFRAAIINAAWRDAPQPREPVEMVALRSSGEADVFLPPWTGGAFFGFWGTGIIVAPVTNRFGRETMLKHEMVHAIMQQLDLNRNAPVWFGEGVAQYLATTSYDEGKDEVTFGGVDAETLRAAFRLGLCPLRELWTRPADLIEKSRHQATSWLLVHYLFNHERERFQRFQAGLGSTANARLLWAEIFPELASDDALDSALRNYVQTGVFSTYLAVIPHPRFNLVSRSMSDAEVHALWAQLYWLSERQDNPALGPARRELAEALRLDPTNVRARAVQYLALEKERSDVQSARALTAAHPESWQGWVVLAKAHTRRGEHAKAAEAAERARALGFRGDAPARSHAASPY